MPFSGFKLCHHKAPDSCNLKSKELLADCNRQLRAIEKKFAKSVSLAEVRTGSKAGRKALLERFSIEERKENGKAIARGIYLMFDGNEAKRDNAFYVGIGNNVPQRLCDHLRAASHNQSSLLYLLMKRHLPEEALQIWDEKKSKTREKRRAELLAEYKTKCVEIRDHLMKTCRVVIHPVPDIMTLHLLEGLAALEFKTGPWNSFKPH